MKRFVAAILAIVMLLSTFSFTALAAAPEQLPQTDPAVQQLQTTALPPVGLDTRPYAAAMAQQQTGKLSQSTTSDQLSMTATDSLSALLLAGMPDADPDAENSGSDAQNYRVIDAGVTGQTATVRYFAAGTADLVVGIYSTDSKQLLASGTIQVEQTEETMAEIPLTGTLPQYFVIKVFLLDTEEHSALSDTYVSTLFTEEMSDLKEAKASDFDPELVVNLDERDDTNFGVVKADVAVLDNDTVAPDENVITQDTDSYVYTVENPTEEFRNLQAGDTFVYHSPEGLLVARVQDIQEEGGKLVITGDEELDIRDVFDLLKIDSDQDSSEFHYVEGSAESGADGSVTSNVTVQESAIVDFSPEALEYTGEGTDAIHTAADDADADNGFVDDLTEDIGNIFEPKKDNQSKEKTLKVLMDKEYKKKYTDDLEYSVKLHIDSSVAVNANFAYYIAWDRVYVAGSAALSIKGVYGVEADLKATVDLGEYDATDAMTGISFGVAASIDVDLNASATVTLLTTATIGASYQLGYGFRNLSSNPYYQMTADANVVVKATLHLSPYIGAAYNLVRLYFNLSFENTLTAHAIFRGADSEDVPESRDGCDPVCFAFNMHITCSGELQIGMRLIFEKDDIMFDPFTLWKNAELFDGDAYWSPFRKEFAFTKCPHTEYRVTATLEGVNNTTALPLYLQKDGNTPELIGECTYVNPTKFYLEHGEAYRLYSVVDGVVFATDEEFTLDKALEVTLTKHPEISLDDLLNSGRVDDGSDENRITYTFNEKTGTLIISGEGAMRNYASSTDPISPWSNYLLKIKKIIVREGVTGIGSGAFKGASNLKELYLPESLTHIAQEAFGYFPKSGVKIEYAGTVKQWRNNVSVMLDSETSDYSNAGFVSTVKHCADGNTNAPMAGGSGTKDDPYQIATAAQLDAIHDWPTATYYVLVNDIDLSGIEWVPYSGYINFDGQGHTVSNLTIMGTNINSRVNVGMFGGLKSYWSNYYAGTFQSRVSNLNLKDVNIDITGTDNYTTTLCVGAIVGGYDGFNDSVYIQNCTASGKINVQGGFRAWVGGLTGGGIYIENSTNKVDITYTRGENTYECGISPFGGIASNSTNYGTIVANGKDMESHVETVGNGNTDYGKTIINGVERTAA